MCAFCLDRELTNLILELSEDELRAFADLYEDLTSDGNNQIIIINDSDSD